MPAIQTNFFKLTERLIRPVNARTGAGIGNITDNPQIPDLTAFHVITQKTDTCCNARTIKEKLRIEAVAKKHCTGLFDHKAGGQSIASRCDVDSCAAGGNGVKRLLDGRVIASTVSF